ncbi:MAG: M23 family metallopeptidase [Bacteroidia bacterium]
MKKNSSKYFKKLTNRYRIVILNEKTFEEKTAFALTPLNTLTLFSITFLIFFFMVYGLIAYTPLREYIPGYSQFRNTEEFAELIMKADSMENQLYTTEIYLANLKRIITGTIGETAEDSAELAKPITKVRSEYFKTSREDSLLRDEIENADNYSLSYSSQASSKEKASNILFYPPVKGFISDRFNAATRHYAVDIVAEPKLGIKATMDGTVIFADWSVNTGHVIVLQHANNLISVYKHNSELFKKVGNFVRAGEVIAIIGESGELTTGPHLHFELWQNGHPMDPEKHIVF